MAGRIQIDVIGRKAKDHIMGSLPTILTGGSIKAPASEIKEAVGVQLKRVDKFLDYKAADAKRAAEKAAKAKPAPATKGRAAMIVDADEQHAEA